VRFALIRNHRYNQSVLVAVAQRAIKAALPAFGLGSTGRIMRPEFGQVWDHSPEQEGHRPMLGMR
jgi:hypothetical protein